MSSSPKPVPDLGSLLAKPERRRARPAESPAPDISTPSVEPAEHGTDQVVAPVRSQAISTPTTDAAGEHASASRPRQYTRIRSIQLPRSVHQALQAAAAEQGTTATALMLTAVSTTYRELAGEFTAGSLDQGAGLFDIPQSRRARSEPAVPTTIRMTDAQTTAVEELVAAYGTNRSALFTAALRRYLQLSL